jgi:hypothetical protein
LSVVSRGERSTELNFWILLYFVPCGNEASQLVLAIVAFRMPPQSDRRTDTGQSVLSIQAAATATSRSHLGVFFCFLFSLTTPIAAHNPDPRIVLLLERFGRAAQRPFFFVYSKF